MRVPVLKAVLGSLLHLLGLNFSDFDALLLNSICHAPVLLIVVVEVLLALETVFVHLLRNTVLMSDEHLFALYDLLALDLFLLPLSCYDLEEGVTLDSSRLLKTGVLNGELGFAPCLKLGLGIDPPFGLGPLPGLHTALFNLEGFHNADSVNLLLSGARFFLFGSLSSDLTLAFSVNQNGFPSGIDFPLDFLLLPFLNLSFMQFLLSQFLSFLLDHDSVAGFHLDHQISNTLLLDSFLLLLLLFSNLNSDPHLFLLSLQHFPKPLSLKVPLHDLRHDNLATLIGSFLSHAFPLRLHL